MRIDCHYSRTIHCLVVALHFVAMMAVLGSSIQLIFQVPLIAMLLLLAFRAHRDHRAGSGTRIRAFLIWDQWAELIIGQGEQETVLRVALPRATYASEYLLVLRFEAIDAEAFGRRHCARVISIIPGVLTEVHYGNLMKYLRFGITASHSHSQGVSMVSRASSACSG